MLTEDSELSARFHFTWIGPEILAIKLKLLRNGVMSFKCNFPHELIIY